MQVLSEAVRRRVACISPPDSPDAARVAVLYSGGLDSAVLAALAGEHLPPEEPIDLINVSFGATGDFETPDRRTAIAGVGELRSLSRRPWRLVLVNVTRDEVKREEGRISRLIAPLDTVMDHNIGTAFWFASRGAGITDEAGE